jgi:hypothetical protein
MYPLKNGAYNPLAFESKMVCKMVLLNRIYFPEGTHRSFRMERHFSLLYHQSCLVANQRRFLVFRRRICFRSSFSPNSNGTTFTSTRTRFYINPPDGRKERYCIAP